MRILIAKCQQFDGVKLAANSIRFRLQNHNHLCPHLAMDLSTKPADRLCQIGDKNRAEFARIKFCSLNVLLIYQVVQAFVQFLLSICWHSMSNKLCHISDSNLLTMSDTNSVYNLLPFCNQKLVAGSAQNLSAQTLLSGK